MGRYYCCAIVFGQFLVAAVEYGFISGISRSGGLAIVRNQQLGQIAKVLESVDVAGCQFSVFISPLASA